jgi:hypothetical protein
MLQSHAGIDKISFSINSGVNPGINLEARRLKKLFLKFKTP